MFVYFADQNKKFAYYGTQFNIFLALPPSVPPRNYDILTDGQTQIHSRTQSPSYARCDEGLWPNPYSELASDWLVLTPDIVFLPCFYGIRLWIWPEPLVAPRVRRALGTRMTQIEISTIHRSARKTGSSELWRNLHVKIRSAAFGSNYWQTVAGARWSECLTLSIQNS